MEELSISSGCIVPDCVAFKLGSLEVYKLPGNSLAVQWLGLCASTAGAQVRSLVGELRSCKPHGRAKKKKMFISFLIPYNKSPSA